MDKQAAVGIAIVIAIAATPPAAGQVFHETFEDVGAVGAGQQGPSGLIAKGWEFRNQSAPAGTGTWLGAPNGSWQDDPPFEGAGYLRVDQDSVVDNGVGSSWAILPIIPGLAGGDNFSFYVRGLINYTDVLQVRFSPNGGTSTGSSAADVGDFTVLLHETKQPANIFSAWELIQVAVPGPGRLALRYHAPFAQPLGSGTYYGVDDMGVNIITVEPPYPAPGQVVHWTTAMSPVPIPADRTIVADGTVIVDPGVKIEVASGFGLDVQGAFICAGTALQPVVFTAPHASPAALRVHGSAELRHTQVSGQVFPESGSELIAFDTTFAGPGGVVNALGYTIDRFPFVGMTRCVLQGVPIALRAMTVRLDDVSIQDSYALLWDSYLWLDDVSVDNAPQYGLQLSTAHQPILVDNVHVTNCTDAAFQLTGGGNFHFGPNNGIQGNAYPVELLETAGFMPGSVLPTAGNGNNVVLGPGAGDARDGRSIWPPVGIPYRLDHPLSWFGRLDIRPGVTVQLAPSAGIGFVSSNFFRGLPAAPIRFEPAPGSSQWGQLGVLSEGSGFEYCDFVGGGATVSVTYAAHMENCTIDQGDLGLACGQTADWFVSGSRFTGLDVAAQTNLSVLGAGGLHLNDPDNPNSFSGNLVAIQDVTPGGAASNDARNVWWGDPSGPKHPQNPGGMGDVLTTGGQAFGTPKVDFTPWLTAPPDASNHPPVVRLHRPPFTQRPGDRLHLYWDATDDDNIVEQRVELSLEGNYDFETLVATLPPSARSYEWTVPNPGFLFNAPSFIRVVAVDSSGKRGWDQASLLIPSGENPSTIVFNPMPPLFAAGETMDACWTVLNGSLDFQVGAPFVELSANGTVEGISQFGNCTFASDAPVVSTDSARLVVPMHGSCCNRIDYFFSDPFEIRPDTRIGDAPPQVALLSPSASGAMYQGGTIVPVSWMASDDEAIRSFRVQVSTDGQRTWTTIAEDLPANVTQYDWVLPPSGGVPDAAVRVIAFDHRYQDSSSTRGLQITPGDGIICQPDLGFGGPGASTLSLCGDALTAGAPAVLALTGGPSQQPAFLALSVASNPTPFFGGMLVPVPVLTLITLATDVNGEFSIPFNAPSVGPADVYLQVILASPSQPLGAELSNAVLAKLLP